jgi:hypothetical protein
MSIGFLKKNQNLFFMNAGLLADIILGDSPHLKYLARFFNLLVLDGNGKIVGLNNNILKNTFRSEDQLINQNFAKFFDSEEGKASLQISINKAFKGQPCSVQFNLFDSKVSFKGVILPVYDSGHVPDSLIIIAKEEHITLVDSTEIEDFWLLASKMIEEAGISHSDSIDKYRSKVQKAKILIVEDRNSLMLRLFKKLLVGKKDEVLIAPNSELALLLAKDFKPNVVISDYNPIGNLDSKELAIAMKRDFDVNTIFLSQSGNELRIEDGWLDVHVKNHTDSVSKILELINQLYW